jgi:hypothetical protein
MQQIDAKLVLDAVIKGDVVSLLNTHLVEF